MDDGAHTVTSRRWLLLIVLVGAALRLPWLGRAELFADEPAYILRSITWLDTLLTSSQPTPVDWFDPLPWWSRLSFHDHPPLTFAINHVVHRVLGAGLIAARLPAALLGIASIVLIARLGTRLFDERTGLIAAALFATDAFAVLFARSAMMESHVVFFALMAALAFVRAQDTNVGWLWFGLAFGASLLAKYTSAVWLCGFIAALATGPRPINRRGLAVAFAGTTAVMLPVLVYNAGLLASRGHLDLQLHWLLGQDVPDWATLLGKAQRGDWIDRVAGLQNIFVLMTPVRAIVLLVGLIALAINPRFSSRVSSRISLRSRALLLGTTVGVIVLALVAGSKTRFIYALTPVAALVAAPLVYALAAHVRTVVLALWLVYEAAFSINTHLVSPHTAPWGANNITHSNEIATSDNFAQRIDAVLQSKLHGSRGVCDRARSPATLQAFADRLEPTSGPAVCLLVDPAVEMRTFFWAFARPWLVQGRPFRWLDGDLPNVDEPTRYVFIHFATSSSGAAADLARALEARGVTPVRVVRRQGEPAAEVFTFERAHPNAASRKTD